MTAPSSLTLETPVQPIGPAEKDRAIALLARAFRLDPVCRWTWPDAAQFFGAFPRFVRAFAGAAFEKATAYRHEDFAGVALWLPPRAKPRQAALVRLFEETVAPERREALFIMFEQMEAFHPLVPHWHLPLIGVDPAHQGRGIGAALLAHQLRRCDEERATAYLEATSPDNLRLYKRHGFRALGVIRLRHAPPIFPMARTPR